MQLVNDRHGFWKAFWKSDGICGKKVEVDDPTLRADELGLPTDELGLPTFFKTRLKFIKCG
jgi:hypothetical protein